MKKNITILFCDVDDFCEQVDINERAYGLGKQRKPTRVPGLVISEMVTIILLYHQSPCKNFKYFYKSYLQLYIPDFPKLPSYQRFIELERRVTPYIIRLIHILLNKKDKVNFIDATSLPVCHNKRIYNNKVFKGIAARGNTLV